MLKSKTLKTSMTTLQTEGKGPRAARLQHGAPVVRDEEDRKLRGHQPARV